MFLGRLLLLIGLMIGTLGARSEAQSVRIKDIADLEGVRTNPLVGYGLVVGLNQTGDKLDNSIFTRESLIGMLERLGVNTRDQAAKLQTRDVAAVMVTADLPAFVRIGNKIDVGISAIGDATDLTGGTLLVTPLLAADGEVYAVAQGALVTNAFAARGSAASITRNVPTAGHIANGASIEREVNYTLADHENLHLSLRNPDLTTARRIEEVINATLGAGTALATDPRTVDLRFGEADLVGKMARIEDLMVTPDSPAIVVVDEASGTIVMGDNVRISTVAIAQGNLTIRVTEQPEVAQPGPFSQGQTVLVPRTNLQVSTGSGNKLGVLSAGPTLRDLVAGLNALGVGPRDMISILQSIKAAGALQADLMVR